MADKSPEHGEFDSTTRHAYLDHLFGEDDSLNPEYTKDVVKYYIPDALGKQMAPDRLVKRCEPKYSYDGDNPGLPPGGVDGIEEREACATFSPDVVAKLLYMDVGRWGGSGHIRDNTDKRWGYCRDFGLVCGNTALLCGYSPPKKRETAPGNGTDFVPPKDLNPGIRDSNVYKAMIPLLNHLSTNAGLGPVHITKALACKSPYSRTELPPQDEIHVFLGDVHAPIITTKKRTYYGNDAHPPINGRLDVDEVKKLVLKRAALTALFVGGLPKFGPGLVLAFKIIWAQLLELRDDILESQDVSATWDKGTLSYDEATEWFFDYHGDDEKGADIFDGAASDLIDWVMLLVSYQRDKTPSNKPLRFIQTGDMFDFWIGLKTGIDYTDFDRDNPPDISHLHGETDDFVDFWLRETTDMENNTQAQAMQTLLKMDRWLPVNKKIEPVFLYGNHDNYLGGLNKSIAALTNVSGLHAEHGHACDTFNFDDDPSMGWLITQIAFLFPKVRDFENWLTAAKAWISGDNGPRLIRFEHALNRCVFDPILKKGARPKLIFVMGHSHEPMLKEIQVISRGY